MSDDTTFGPCPFCGSTNTTYHVYPQYFVGACRGCHATGPAALDIEVAARAWNKPVERIGKLETACKAASVAIGELLVGDKPAGLFEKRCNWGKVHNAVVMLNEVTPDDEEDDGEGQW